jgi:hypothetical protein
MGRSQDYLLEPGLVKRVEYVPNEPASCLAIILNGGLVAWRFRIFALGSAQGERSGSALVGCVRSLPWNGGAHLIAVATCPGAQRWAVDGAPEDHTNRDAVRLDFISSGCCSLPGVQPIPGASLATAHHLRSQAGVSGAVTVTQPVMGWSAIGGAVAGSVAIQFPGLPLLTIPLPAGASVGDSWGDAGPSGVTFTFANTESYLITTSQPGDGIDVF